METESGPPMPHPPDSLDLGAVRCAWGPYRRGERAEPQARRWLAAQLAVDEEALGLWRDARGRPHLGPAHVGLDANWSHSGERLLVALARGARVGADIEWLRPRPRAMTLARRFFTPREAALLAALPAAEAEDWFVRLWCAKEAVLKAHGHGIAFGLEKLEFTREPDGWRLHACDPALGAPGDWRLHAFTPAPGYLATLAWRPSPAADVAPGPTMAR